MASAKQIAWRKKFAKMAKAGKFRKVKKKHSKAYDEYTHPERKGSTRTRYESKKSNPHKQKQRKLI